MGNQERMIQLPYSCIGKHWSFTNVQHSQDDGDKILLVLEVSLGGAAIHPPIAPAINERKNVVYGRKAIPEDM